MERRTMIAALFAATLAAQPLAGAAQSQEKPAAKPRAGMQMDPKLQQQMIERLKTMQAEMAKIRETSDPQERQKLLAEHMKTMQEGMQAMGGMGGGMMGRMGGGGMMGGGATMGGKGGRPQSPQMMEQRMDMMQMMMDQMMEHMQMMQPAPGK